MSWFGDLVVKLFRGTIADYVDSLLDGVVEELKDDVAREFPDLKEQAQVITAMNLVTDKIVAKIRSKLG